MTDNQFKEIIEALSEIAGELKLLNERVRPVLIELAKNRYAEK